MYGVPPDSATTSMKGEIFRKTDCSAMYSDSVYALDWFLHYKLWQVHHHTRSYRTGSADRMN
jgi:hypothetical protein